VNDDLERIWKEAVICLIFRYYPGIRLDAQLSQTLSSVTSEQSFSKLWASSGGAQNQQSQQAARLPPVGHLV
jgi:hypothetical protein